MAKRDNGIHGFMGGRNGFDNLSRVLLFTALGVFILTALFRIWALAALGGILVCIALYRIFSKKLSRRYAENQTYMQLTENVRSSVYRFYLRRKDKKTHKIFKCPNCSQKIRVPKGKGEIKIKCPSCRIEFVQSTGAEKKS